MSPFREKKKLYRNRKKKMIGGVCAGLADYFDIDKKIIRILALVALFTTGHIAFITYWVAFFLLDANPQTLTDSDGNLQSGFSSNHQRRSVLNSVSDRYEKIEERLQKIEAYVTSPKQRLRSEIDNL